jgi:RHS repeat-associated protein
VSYGYDAVGNQVTITRDEGGLNQLTAIGYDALGNAVGVTDPNGNTSRSAYDLNRRVVSAAAPAAIGLVTSFAYDADGRLIQTRQFTGGALLRTTGATYTPTGKPLTATDANGNVTRYGYDRLDRLASLRDAIGVAGGLNRYAYVSNDPLNLLDPFGPAATAGRRAARGECLEPHRRQ